MQNLVNEVKKQEILSSSLMKFTKSSVLVALAGDSGSKGLADILKPALSRGELTVIGATTQMNTVTPS